MATHCERAFLANIQKIYWFGFFMMFLTIIPVLVPFWQQNGMSMKQVYLLPAIYSFSLVLLDVPTGYLSDIWGRRRTLILAGVFNGLSFSVLAMCRGFSGFAAFEVVSALAVSLCSGCDVAMIYDSLEASHSEFNGRNVLGARFFYSQIGETVAAVLGGLLAFSSLMLPAMINAVVGWVPLMIALTLVEPPAKRQTSGKGHWHSFRNLFVSLFIHTPDLRRMIFFHLFFAFATFSAVWSFQIGRAHV